MNAVAFMPFSFSIGSQPAFNQMLHGYSAVEVKDVYFLL
ncbi:hypothetical protein KKH3_20400 [Pectobacterium actinidiae]|nr:hypothetical protein KKH3_20400 [Pectobacterium actinidiae]